MTCEATKDLLNALHLYRELQFRGQMLGAATTTLGIVGTDWLHSLS